MKWLLPAILMMVGGGFLVLPDGGGGRIKPADQSPLAVACVTYRDLLTTVATTAIGKLEAGELATDIAARDWIEAARKEAQRTAWRKIAERDQEKLGGGKWSTAEHAATLREMIGE